MYFDVVGYGKSSTHYYGKLVPENVGNDEATAEGEVRVLFLRHAGDTTLSSRDTKTTVRTVI